MTSATLLLRQVHPTFVKPDGVTSSAFSPFPKDNGHLSVDDNELVTAEQSYVRYTKEQGFDSVGVWAVTMQEAEDSETPAVASPIEANSAHCHLDFTSHGKNKQRKLAKRLRNLAVNRGCLFSGEL